MQNTRSNERNVPICLHNRAFCDCRDRDDSRGRAFRGNSPKIGYAVLLLHTGVKGAEFYDKMRLSSFPGNRVRREAEEILKGGLANFDVESYKWYKSKFNDIYREEEYALLNVIIEMLG